MGGYKTVVVGTDGSVPRFAQSTARATSPPGPMRRSSSRPPTSQPPRTPGQRTCSGRGIQDVGQRPIYAILREAKDRAIAAGATNVEERPIVGAPVDALVDLAEEVHADLLVVGNVGLSTIAGRLLGSVPANVARRSKTDVLIVHTTG